MLVVKIELWPGGSQARAREVGRVLIANVGGDGQRATYAAQCLKSAAYSRTPGVWRAGRVIDFPRKLLGPYDLVLRALVACALNRNRADVRVLGTRTLGDQPIEDMP